MGLALPDFLHYYWASNIHKGVYWLSQFYHNNGPVWAEMEQASCNPVSLTSMLCTPLLLSKKSLMNPTVINTLKIWSHLRSYFKYKQILPLLPITANALFPPSLLDSTFQLWFRKGLRCIRDLYQDNNFILF